MAEFFLSSDTDESLINKPVSWVSLFHLTNEDMELNMFTANKRQNGI